MISRKARKYIAHKIKKIYLEGKSISQATAIAYSMAWKKGFKVPKRTAYKYN